MKVRIYIPPHRVNEKQEDNFLFKKKQKKEDRKGKDKFFVESPRSKFEKRNSPEIRTQRESKKKDNKKGANSQPQLQTSHSSPRREKRYGIKSLEKGWHAVSSANQIADHSVTSQGLKGRGEQVREVL